MNFTTWLHWSTWNWCRDINHFVQEILGENWKQFIVWMVGKNIWKKQQHANLAKKSATFPHMQYILERLLQNSVTHTSDTDIYFQEQSSNIKPFASKSFMFQTSAGSQQSGADLRQLTSAPHVTSLNWTQTRALIIISTLLWYVDGQ